MNCWSSRRKRKLEGDTDMTMDSITAILPIKTTGVSSKIIFITKFLKMIGAENDEYVKVTIEPFKSRAEEKTEERTEERTEE